MSLGQCRNCRFCKFKEFRSWYDNWNAIQMLSSGDDFASRNSHPFACMNNLDDDIQIRMTSEGVYSGRLGCEYFEPSEESKTHTWKHSEDLRPFDLLR